MRRGLGSIAPLRRRIDSIDDPILKLVAQRKKVVQQMLRIKRLRRMPIRDRKREEQIIKRLSSHRLLSHADIKALYKAIFRISCSRKKK